MPAKETVSTPNVKEALRVPLVQAQAKIKAQIDEGIKIKKSSAEITNIEKFATVKADFQKWLECTQVVLEQIFVTDKKASEFVGGEPAIIALLSGQSLSSDSENLQEVIRRACNQLDFIYETLPHYSVASVGAGLADVLLVTATDVETRAVLELAEEKNRVVQRHFGDRTYYEIGTIGGAKTFMVWSEMGSDGSGGSLATTMTAIEELQPWAVIAVGIAFGVNPQKQTIGDILVSEKVRVCGGPRRVGTDSKGRRDVQSREDCVPASPKLLSRFREGKLNWEKEKKPKVAFGLVLSVPDVVDNIDYRNELLKLETKAIGGEMESKGLFAAAYNRDWIVVKAICDFADGKKHEDKNARQQQAASNAASFVFFVLERGGLARSGSASPINSK